MDPSPPAGGWGRARGGRSEDGTRYGDSLDGRLDLDHLDEATTLDIVGDDERPLLSERIREHLESAGVLPWMRGHRVVTGLVATAAAAAVVATGVWWSARPQPMAEPKVSVTTGGNEPARLVVDPSTGHVTAITQLVLVTSDEPAGTYVDTLGVTGPGLVQPQSRVITAQAGDTVTGALTSQVDCASPAATAAVGSARAGDYRVQIRRTSERGDVRDDSVPLAGGEEWLNDIRGACTQIAAERDLAVVAVDVQPVPGVIATDVRLLVRNRSGSTWRAMHVSTDAGPTIVSSGPDVDIPAGEQAWVPVRLWPDDCSDPVAPLAGGVPLRADIGEGPAAAGRTAPTFTLPLDTAALDSVAAALRTTCTATPPTAALVSARVAGSVGDPSAGTITMFVDITAPAAFLVEIQSLPAGPGGQVTAFESPVVVSKGVARVHLRWDLPQCFDLLASGAPRLHVRLVTDDVRRPYLLTLHGEGLRLNVDRICGPTVASIVR